MLKFFETERPLGGWPSTRDRASGGVSLNLVCRCGHGGTAHEDVQPGSRCLVCDCADDGSSCPADGCCVGYRPQWRAAVEPTRRSPDRGNW